MLSLKCKISSYTWFRLHIDLCTVTVQVVVKLHKVMRSPKIGFHSLILKFEFL